MAHATHLDASEPPRVALSAYTDPTDRPRLARPDQLLVSASPTWLVISTESAVSDVVIDRVRPERGLDLAKETGPTLDPIPVAELVGPTGAVSRTHAQMYRYRTSMVGEHILEASNRIGRALLIRERDQNRRPECL